MTSSPAQAAQPELDEALLQRAWRMLRPPNWPQTYAECMADALRARLVQMYARQLVRSDAAAARGNAWPQPAPAAALANERRRPMHALPTGTVDRKRAAAGDRDDD
jgi:hypothetical protein